jgi:hypothetical protein
MRLQSGQITQLENQVQAFVVQYRICGDGETRDVNPYLPLLLPIRNHLLHFHRLLPERRSGITCLCIPGTLMYGTMYSGLLKAARIILKTTNGSKPKPGLRTT